MSGTFAVSRLLSASTATFVAGSRVGAPDIPSFGALVQAPIGPQEQVFGLIYDVRIEDDGLVRQLVTAEGISDEVIRDNRERRIVPVELAVVVVGWNSGATISHQLPPRPPLSLDTVTRCDSEGTRRFTSVGRFAYFRHLLRVPDLPLGELLAAHIRQAAPAQVDPAAWTAAAVQEIVVLLRDDYQLLTAVLAAVQGVLGDMPPDNSDKQ